MVVLPGAILWELDIPGLDRQPLAAISILALLILIVREKRQQAAYEFALAETLAALTAAESGLRGLFDSSPDVLCVYRLAPDGTIFLERFNPAAARARGLDASAVGKPLEQLVPASTFAAASRTIERAAATGETIRLHSDTGPFGIDSEIIVVPLPVEDGSTAPIDRVFISIRDIKHLKEAQAAAAQSETRYRVLAESVNDMITRLSLPNLDRVYVSPVCRSLLGYEPRELMARHPNDDVHPDDIGGNMAVITSLLSDQDAEPASPVTFRMRHKTGRWIWVEASLGLTRTIDGVVDGVICAVRDVDTPRRAEMARAASETRFRLLAESASELIVLGDDQGRRSYISPASERLLGFTPDELEFEMRSRRWVHPDDLAHLSEAELKQDGGDTAVLCRVRRKDESWIWVEAMFRHIPAEFENEPTVIATFRDVSGHQAQAMELREARDAADAARHAAEQASRAKSDFLATMSHEIRTPLNAILGFADLLHGDTTLAHPSRGYLDRVRNAGSALRTIVDDILDFSKLEVGKVTLKLSDFRLAALVDNATSIVQGLADRKQLALAVSIEPRISDFVRGDHDRLRQILVNLLNNAIKFTRQGSVTLTVRACGEHDGMAILRFCVIDTGIGIAAEQVDAVFQRFTQVDTSFSREFGGTGLGLTICRRLAAAMGGSIGVESALGVGSTFWLELALPIAASASEGSEGFDVGDVEMAADVGEFDDLVSAISRSAAKQRRRALEILLVEDVLLNQELIGAILETRGHRVDIVGNGGEAIMAVEDKAYDLVLMDLQMPHVDGLMATRFIRNLATPRRFVPIVALTAAVLQEQTDLAIAAGMDGVLTKPVSLPALDEVLGKTASDELRGAIDTSALDEDIVDQLARTIGSAKVRSMGPLLATTLTARFTQELTGASSASLRAEAHASIAGAAMLGFARFGSLCRAFIAATGTEEAVAYDQLRRELALIVRILAAADKQDSIELTDKAFAGKTLARVA